MSTDEITIAKKKHDLIMESRKNLNMNGVSDVKGFDDEKIIITTVLGELTVKGSRLHIGSFSQESGELHIDGEINELHYSENKQNEGGFFSKLFR